MLRLRKPFNNNGGLVSYLWEKNIHPNRYKNVTRHNIFAEKYYSCVDNQAESKKQREDSLNAVTSVADTSQEIKNCESQKNHLLDSAETSAPDAVDSQTANCDSTSINLSDLSLYDKEQLKPTSHNSAIVSSGRSNYRIYDADLSTAFLPISLHYRDENIFVAAFAQELDQLYSTTSHQVNKWYLLTHQQGQLCYVRVEEFSRQPVIQQNCVKLKAVALTTLRESALWFCEHKPTTEKTTATTENIFDKIKKTIENILTSLKQKLNEQKQASDEKKESSTDNKK